MITVLGASDDLVCVEGDINEQWDYGGDDADWAGDVVAFSDGTVLRVQFAEDGFWRITPHAKGPAFLRIDQASDEDEDYSDKARVDGDVRWVVHGRHYAKR